MSTDAQRQNDARAIGARLDGLHARVDGLQQMVVQNVADGIWP